MAKSRNAAFAGDATMPNGVVITVLYLDRAGLVAAFGHQPPGHPNRRPIGWYWRPAKEENGWHSLAGPFTSSRLALRDALARNGGLRNAA